MAGLFAMGDLSHELETLLARVSDDLLPTRPAATSALVGLPSTNSMRCATQYRRAPSSRRRRRSWPGWQRRCVASLPMTCQRHSQPKRRSSRCRKPDLRSSWSRKSSTPGKTSPSRQSYRSKQRPAVEAALAEEEQLLLSDEQPVVDPGELLDFDLEADLDEVLASEAGTGLHFELIAVEESPAVEEAPTAAEVSADEEVPIAGEYLPDEEALADEDALAEQGASIDEELLADEESAGETAAEVSSEVFAGPAALPPALERLGELARELEAPPVRQPIAEPRLPRQPVPSPRTVEPRDFARVDSGLLEQLLNGAGEISIANARLTQQQAQLQFNLEELNQTVVRLRDQLRKLEIETEAQILYRHQAEAERETGFDPLELDRYSTIQQLSRALAETANDVSSIKDLLQNVSADAEGCWYGGPDHRVAGRSHAHAYGALRSARFAAGAPREADRQGTGQARRAQYCRQWRPRSPGAGENASALRAHAA